MSSVKAEAESELLEGSEEEEEETSGNLQVKSLEEIQREKALNSLRSNLSKQIEELNEDVEEAAEEEIEEKPPVKKLRTKRSPKQEQVIYRPPAAKRKGR